MPDYLIDPKTFDAASRHFEQKAVMPTGLNSREISNRVPVDIRGQAFFSSQVSSARILENLQDECRAILAGKTSYQEARTRLKEFLAREGYGIPKPGTREDKDLANIAGDSRLQLILRQNVRMSQAVGQRQVSEHPYVEERYPNYKYHANTARHAKFDGLVLPKKHPFWKKHYPPWDFGCNCMVTDEEGEPNARGSAQRLQFKSRAVNVDDPKSGFEFESSPEDAFKDLDPSIIEDEQLRALVTAALEARGL